MLRFNILIALQLLFCYVSAQSSNFVIKGKFNAQNGTTIFLKYSIGEKAIWDSTKLRNNTFLFNGIVEAPTQAYVTNQESIIQFVPFFLLANGDSLDIQFKDNSFEKPIVKGSKLNLQLNNYRTYYNLVDSMYQSKIKDLNRDKEDSVIQVYNNFKKSQLITYSKDFIEKNPDSYVSIFLLYQIISENELLADSLFKKLQVDLQQSTYGKRSKTAIDFKSLSSIGKKAPNFILADTSGINHTLDSFKGKYVLVDFWASWCGPCRAEAPNILKAYHMFKEKKFEVIGISIDDGYHYLAWKDAIIKDQTNWLQLLDDKKANVADAYGISYIPANILINPDGIIVAKNIKGTILLETLRKYLNK